MGLSRAIRGLVAVLVALGAVAPAAHASLGVPAGGPAIPYTSLAAFEAAAGGSDNGAIAGEQGSGFRHINWDAVALNGSDPASTAIPGGHTVAVARGLLQPWGIELGPEIAVANDGFRSVSSNASFTPFSAPNMWGPFNSTTAEFDIVAPGGEGSTPTVAQTRGLGIVFLGASGSTQIQYYNGDILLGSVPAPAPAGATSFAGLLFPDPVVTRVVVLLGGAEIFAFDGSTVTPGGPNPVAGDDVVLAEPAPARGALTATAGVPVTATLDTFTESNPNATPTAQIDWGDGTRSTGTIAPGSGGVFVVSGSHAYAQTGSYTATVTVDDLVGPEQTRQTSIRVGTRTTTTNLSCSPSSVAVSASTTCTATVTDVAGGSATAPAGLIAFSSPTPSAAFAQNGACLLGPTAVTGVSSCTVLFTPGQLPEAGPRRHRLRRGQRAHGRERDRHRDRPRATLHAEGPDAAATVTGPRRSRDVRRSVGRRYRRQGVGRPSGTAQAVPAPVRHGPLIGRRGATDGVAGQAVAGRPPDAAGGPPPSPARVAEADAHRELTRDDQDHDHPSLGAQGVLTRDRIRRTWRPRSSGSAPGGTSPPWPARRGSARAPGRRRERGTDAGCRGGGWS